MITTLSLSAILVWFVWGFFMGLGWAIASWLWGKITAALSI